MSRRWLLVMLVVLVAVAGVAYWTHQSARAPGTEGGAPAGDGASTATAANAAASAPAGEARATATVGGPALSVAAATEVAVQAIEIVGPLSVPAAEVSSLVWISDTLVFLPQYPGRFGVDGTVVTDTDTGSGTLFGVRRADVTRAVEGPAPKVEPFAIPLADAGFGDGEPRAIAGFEGFEAIAYRDGFAYLSIEVQNGDDMEAFLVRGRVDADADGVPIGITIEDRAPVAVPLPIDIDNMSIESLIADDDGVLALFEANGAAVNPAPRAWRFSRDLVPDGEPTMPTVEYRVTDATEPDADGSFWVLNYMFPGDADDLKPSADAIAARWGEGATHGASDRVERIVRLTRTADRLEVADQPPIQLQLADGRTSRNWEGIVRFGDAGFLVVTDKFPATLFGFVAGP